jgi:hypothetical protein
MFAVMRMLERRMHARLPIRASQAAALLLLAGCGFTEPGLIAPFGRAASPAPADSLTAMRVMGQDPGFDPLNYEPGTVWPAPSAETPRITLGNPDDVLRTPPPAPPREPPVRRGSSSPPPPPSVSGVPPVRFVPLREVPAEPPPPRADGRVIPIPGGPPAVTTGGTPGGVQTFTVPGQGGAGVAVPQGATTTLIGPDGRVRVVPTPR